MYLPDPSPVRATVETRQCLAQLMQIEFSRQFLIVAMHEPQGAVTAMTMFRVLDNKYGSGLLFLPHVFAADDFAQQLREGADHLFDQAI